MKMIFAVVFLAVIGAAHGAPLALRGSVNSTTTDDLPYELHRSGRRHLQVGGMVPLSCNKPMGSCRPWSTVFGTHDVSSTEITIPCGQCVIMDHSAPTLTLEDGLNIQGKLVFPNGYDGLTLYTTKIVVQGILQMISSKRVNGEPSVKVVLTGNSDQYFEPINENANYCGGRLCSAGKKSITVAGGEVNIRALTGDTPTWVNLYDVTGSDSTTEGIVVEDSVLNKWAVGSEILITAHSNEFDGEQVRTIDRIDTRYSKSGFVRLFLDRPIARPTTLLEDRKFAVEVALLSRNIVFEGGPDSTTDHGGHFWVFETPGSRQRLEGVDFVNFGQQGKLGRYPIHFHMCGDVSGSVVAKNTVRHSFQRCIVAHATDNLLIKENVAYSTAGHCFMLEDGIESGNEFIRNLGAKTFAPTIIIPDMGTNGKESDKDDPSTFWIPSASNSWVGNVAAGSEDSGFWFEPMVRGPLAPEYGDRKAQKVQVVQFEDNVAHSNALGFRTYPRKGLRPEQRPNYFVALKAYRNRIRGLFVFFCHNLVIMDSVFADNGINLEIDNSLNVDVYNVQIMGETAIYRQQQQDQELRYICVSQGMIGLQLNTDDYGSVGANIHSATFSDYDNTVLCNTVYEMRLDNLEISTNDIPQAGDIPSPTVPAPGESPDGYLALSHGLRFNCGATQEIDNGAGVWMQDTYFENGNGIQLYPNNPMLFNQFREQDDRSGKLSYAVPLANGNYKVKLYWAETEKTGAGQRKFNVYINGDKVLDDFDVFHEAGGRDQDIYREFNGITTNNSELKIELEGTVDKAFLSLFSVFREVQ